MGFETRNHKHKSRNTAVIHLVIPRDRMHRQVPQAINRRGTDTVSASAGSCGYS